MIKPYPLTLNPTPLKDGIYLAQDKSELIGVDHFLSFLDNFYPGFMAWYENKVVENLSTNGSIVLLSRENGKINGIALGKLTDTETKLRCVRVHPEYQNTGLGFRLIERMFEHLNTEHPHCTVAEEMLHLYSRAFINRYGFDLTHVSKGMYRKGKLEYMFN